jgi:hypothetical protein
VPSCRIIDKVAKKWELDESRGLYDAVKNWNVELEQTTLKALRKATGDLETFGGSPRSACAEAQQHRRASGPRHTWWGGIEEDSVAMEQPQRQRRPEATTRETGGKPFEQAAVEKPEFNKASKIKPPKTPTTGRVPEATEAHKADLGQGLSSRLRPRASQLAEQPKSCWREEPHTREQAVDAGH